MSTNPRCNFVNPRLHNAFLLEQTTDVFISIFHLNVKYHAYFIRQMQNPRSNFAEFCTYMSIMTYTLIELMAQSMIRRNINGTDNNQSGKHCL